MLLPAGSSRHPCRPGTGRGPAELGNGLLPVRAARPTAADNPRQSHGIWSWRRLIEQARTKPPARCRRQHRQRAGVRKLTGPVELSAAAFASTVPAGRDRLSDYARPPEQFRYVEASNGHRHASTPTTSFNFRSRPEHGIDRRSIASFRAMCDAGALGPSPDGRACRRSSARTATMQPLDRGGAGARCRR